jgi:hypothetical protein
VTTAFGFGDASPRPLLALLRPAVMRSESLLRG